MNDACFPEGYFSGVEFIFKNFADCDVCPFMSATGLLNFLFGELVGDLPEGLAGQKQVFYLEDDGSADGVLFGDGFTVCFVSDGFAIAKGNGAFWESFFEDAFGHADAVAAFEGGDLGAADEGGGEFGD